VSWKTVALGDVCSIINGGTPKSEVAEYWDGDLNWITPKEMGKLLSREISSTERKITDKGMKNSSAKLLPINSVILSSRAPIGHLAINKALMATNQGCKGLVPSEVLNYEYLYYFLSHSKQLLNDMGSGATFKELSGSKLATVEIPLPSFSTQQKIVDKLDAIFAEIDKATAAAEANAENSEALFQSYLTQVFERGGVDWIVKYLGEISENLDSKRIPITKGVREEGQIPYYGASGIVDYVKNYIFDGDILLISEDGANLLARTYPIAFSVNGKCWVNNHAHVVRFPNLISQVFVEFYLNSISLKPFVSGMAQPKLNQAMLNKIPIPFPSLEEQGKLVNLFQSIKKSADISKKSYLTKVEELSYFKQSILKQAFNGELVKE